MAPKFLGPSSEAACSSTSAHTPKGRMDAADHRILTKTATASQPQQRMVSSPKVTDTPLHPSTSKSTRPDPPCPLAELVQYDCRIAVQRLPEGNVGECIVCEEVPRIFRL